MSTWKWNYKINFVKFYHDDFLSIKDKVGKIINELQIFMVFNKANKYAVEDLIDIIEEFNSYVNNIEDFDSCMDMLYDWADENSVWISTR